MSRSVTFERRFTGASNAGLRAEIRGAVRCANCGPANARGVLAVGRRVALTAQGRAILDLVANDYREAGGSYNRRCECADCYGANLQALGVDP